MGRISCRAIIIKDDKLVLMHRIFEGRDYYTFPGGGLEENETLEECVIREVKEEFGIDILVIKEMYQNEWAEAKQYFYYCKWVSGEFGTGIGPEMVNSQRGLYFPELISVKEITEINLQPEDIVSKLVLDIEDLT